MHGEVIFQPIFGADWHKLPPVMHKHYANHAYSNDVVTVEGKMKVEISFFAKLLMPFLHLSGALVPYSGDNIPVTVHFRSEPDSNAFVFDRIFHFPDKQPYHFLSKMCPVAGNEVAEFMPIGIGWRAAFSYQQNKVIMQPRGYVAKLFGKHIPVPIGLILGHANAWEEAIDDNRFRMHMDVRHPLFGRIYSYHGEFGIKEIRL